MAVHSGGPAYLRGRDNPSALGDYLSLIDAVRGPVWAALLEQRLGSLPKVVAQTDETITAIVSDLRCVSAISALRDALSAVTTQDVALRRIDDSAKLYGYLACALARSPAEQLRGLWLDRRHYLIADDVLATGTVDEVRAYPREIVRRALERNASRLVLVHNHPSGDASPSAADIEFTRRLALVLDEIACPLSDHLIVTAGSMVSMRAGGLL